VGSVGIEDDKTLGLYLKPPRGSRLGGTDERAWDCVPLACQGRQCFGRVDVPSSCAKKSSCGKFTGDRVQLVDYEEPAHDDWLVINQFTVIEGRCNRRPDIVVFVNGVTLYEPAQQRLVPN
jgi:hypothetical protein